MNNKADKISKQMIRGIRKHLKPIFVTLTIFLTVSIVCLILVRNESIKNAGKTADYFVQNIDSQLINLTAHSHSLINDDKAKAISSILDSQADVDSFSSLCVKLNTYAREFCMANPIVDDVVYYYPKYDLVIDRYGVLNAKKYCAISNLETLNSGEKLSLYLNSLFLHEHNCFFTADSPNGAVGDFFFYRSFPDNTLPDDAERIILLKFNKSRISEMMKELAELMNQNYICMLTNEGEIFVEAGTLSADENKSAIADNLGKKKITFTHSNVWNMDVYIEPNLSETERFIRSIAIISLAGIASACILGVVIVLRDYYETIRIVKPVLDKTGGVLAEPGSEAFDIDEIMVDMLNNYYESNNMQSETIEKQKNQIRALRKEYSALEKVIKEAKLQPDGETIIENEKYYENVADYASKIIEEGYANPGMGLAMIADIIGVSQAYLSRAFKKEKNENISVFLSEIRIRHAKELLVSSNDTISAISQKIGFVSDVTFIRVFKKITGETPNVFRKNAQNYYQNLT